MQCLICFYPYMQNIHPQPSNVSLSSARLWARPLDRFWHLTCQTMRFCARKCLSASNTTHNDTKWRRILTMLVIINQSQLVRMPRAWPQLGYQKDFCCFSKLISSYHHYREFLTCKFFFTFIWSTVSGHKLFERPWFFLRFLRFFSTNNFIHYLRYGNRFNSSNPYTHTLTPTP